LWIEPRGGWLSGDADFEKTARLIEKEGAEVVPLCGEKV
jgi:hypothetical protein